jgi:hypothetical protein
MPGGADPGIGPDWVFQRKEEIVRQVFCFAAAGLITGLLLHTGSAGGLSSSPIVGTKKPAPEICTTGTCGQYGTTVNFVKTPSEAARLAAKEEKLVLVLHVSGDFEDPDFT